MAGMVNFLAFPLYGGDERIGSESRRGATLTHRPTRRVIPLRIGR